MKVFVTGGHGMVGTALRPRLASDGMEVSAPSSHQLDLRDARALDAWLSDNPVDAVIHLAARSGGMGAKLADPTGFFSENLAMICNVIDASRRHAIQRLVLVGSACVYPLGAAQPTPETALLGGPLEPANEGYGLAKVCGSKLCEYVNRQFGTRYVTLHPCNLLGPNDRFDAPRAQVVPSLLGRFHCARVGRLPTVEVWGTGGARREFLYVDDLVDAICFFLEHAEDVPAERPWINIGYGSDVTIRELASLIADTTGFRGDIVFDATRPDGMPRRLLDSSLAASLGWKARTPLRQALAQTYAWYLENEAPR